MNMKTRLKRGAIGALAALMVFAAGAFADDQTSTSSVTTSVVSGQRFLQVTGTTGDPAVPAGPVSLAFNGSDPTPAPFGVVVTDLAHPDVGYEVTATLTNLHRLTADGYDCNAASIPSSGFSISYVNRLDPIDVKSVIDPLMTFTDADITDDLEAVLDPEGDGDLTLDAILTALGADTELVVDVAGIVDEWSSTLGLMQVANGQEGPFSVAAPHDGCGTGDAVNATPRDLQTGTPGNISLTDLRGEVFDAVEDDADGDDLMSSAEALASALMGSDWDQAGKPLYEATHLALNNLLGDSWDLLTAAEKDALTDEVILDLTAPVTDLVVDLIGQSGVYQNVPALSLNPDDVGNATTGLYHGTMTVTLTDVE